MEFFDKKEEVLDFQLTEYGKHLLASGQLRPAYYAFFDDEILYDVLAAGSAGESQNEAFNRIRFQTPSMKVTPTRTGAESRQGLFLQQGAFSSNTSDPADTVGVFQDMEVFETKGKLASHPLGTSSPNSIYNPAWSVEVLSEPNIVSSVRYFDDNGIIENIPQINVNVEYDTFFKEGRPGMQALTGHLEDTNIYLALDSKYLLLEIFEENAEFGKQNFDIEVFHSGSDPEGATYIPLAFRSGGRPMALPNPIENDENLAGDVEYYMQILVDEELTDELLTKHGIPALAVYTNASRLKLNKDLYVTTNTEPCE
jgi:hypothetical protein